MEGEPTQLHSKRNLRNYQPTIICRPYLDLHSNKHSVWKKPLYGIYEKTGNLNTDWIFDDTKGSLLIV